MDGIQAAPALIGEESMQTAGSIRSHAYMLTKNGG